MLQLVIEPTNRVYKTKADATGTWKFLMDPFAAGGDFKISVSTVGLTAEAITLEHVTFGDVWFCSGQSLSL